MIYAAVLSVCTMICAGNDSKFDYFGGANSPMLFVLAGLIRAILSSVLYACFLHH